MLDKVRLFDRKAKERSPAGRRVNTDFGCRSPGVWSTLW